MGAKMSAADADEYMAYLTVFPIISSVLGCTFTFMMCYYISHNYDFFPTKIVMRICFATAAYSLCILWNPGDNYGWISSEVEVYPVINRKCYVQSVLVIGFENLGCFWQSCLIHNVYEVSVKKNLRPEDLLTRYDNWALTFSLATSLVPWIITGYGWQWYGRCKYNTGDNGSWSGVLTTVVHVFIMIYITYLSIIMYRAIWAEEEMNTNYRMLPALKRQKRHQLKYILVSWVFVLCRVPAAVIVILDVMHFFTTQSLMTMPDDLPFALVGIDSIANDIFGLGLFCVFFTFDHEKARTRIVKCCIFCKDVYCCHKHVDYEIQGRAITDAVILNAGNRDSEVYELIEKMQPLAEPVSPLGVASSPRPASSVQNVQKSGEPTDSTRFTHMLLSASELQQLQLKELEKQSKLEDSPMDACNDESRNETVFGKSVTQRKWNPNSSYAVPRHTL